MSFVPDPAELPELAEPPTDPPLPVWLLWPLPPPGRFRIVCQWLDQGIAQTVR